MEKYKKKSYMAWTLGHTLGFVNDGSARDRQEQTVAGFLKREQISGISSSKLSLLSINNVGLEIPPIWSFLLTLWWISRLISGCYIIDGPQGIFEKH